MQSTATNPPHPPQTGPPSLMFPPGAGEPRRADSLPPNGTSTTNAIVDATASATAAMRLHEESPVVNAPIAARASRKRKTPPTAEDGAAIQPPSPAQPISAPPPHHMQPGMPMPPMGYAYPPNPDFSAQPQHGQMSLGQMDMDPNGGMQDPPMHNGRVLSSSKRAEQNRKAQRAFRERRDAHVKALEQRSQLLDAALASADEANRRWEECRALVDQLRIENAALRAALGQAQVSGLGQPQSAQEHGSEDANAGAPAAVEGVAGAS